MSTQSVTGILANGETQFFDDNGAPLAFGKVYFYIVATTTFKNTYATYPFGAANANPVVLDEAGRAPIWGTGLYRQIVKDSLGNTIWDQVTGSPDITIPDSIPAGAVMDYGGTAAPTGWLLCYGQAVSRTTYADLFTAIGTTFGIGDGSTTFNVPDLRGRSTSGKDDMGGSAASRVTNAVSGITGTTLGSSGGSQSQQLHTHGLFTTSDGTTLYSQVAGSGAAQSGFKTPYVTDGSSGAINPVYAGNTGSGTSQNMQPTLIMNKIIKT